MHQFTRAVPNITDRDTAGAVQIRQTGQTPADQHPVDSRTGYPQAPGHQMRTFSFGDPIHHNGFLGLRRYLVGTGVRTRRTILEAGFSFLLPPPQPPIGGLAGHPHRFGSAGHRPSVHQDPIHQQPPSARCQLPTVSTHRGPPLTRRLVPHESNQGGPQQTKQLLSTTSLGSTPREGATFPPTQQSRYVRSPRRMRKYLRPKVSCF